MRPTGAAPYSLQLILGALDGLLPGTRKLMLWDEAEEEIALKLAVLGYHRYRTEPDIKRHLARLGVAMSMISRMSYRSFVEDYLDTALDAPEIKPEAAAEAVASALGIEPPETELYEQVRPDVERDVSPLSGTPMEDVAFIAVALIIYVWAVSSGWSRTTTTFVKEQGYA